VTLDSPAVTEMAVALGLDFVVVDAEHGSLDWHQIAEHLRATVRSETVALVRLAELSVGGIKRALDIGADGVVIPWMESAEQLAQAVSFARYPQEGVRGIGAERATAWGQALAEHAGEANEHVFVVPIIETVRGGQNLPAMLAVLGTRINSVRVMPRRLVYRGRPEDGAWGRWARCVLRRPVAVAAVGTTIVLTLAAFGTQLNASEAQLANFPGQGTAIAGRQMLADAHITPGVMKPLNVLVEHGGNADLVAARLADVPGVVGASAPAAWRNGPTALVEAFPAIDGSAPGIQAIINRANASLEGTDGTLTGVAAVDRDFLHALFGSFPYVLALVLFLTMILLTRAFRSVVLALKGFQRVSLAPGEKRVVRFALGERAFSLIGADGRRIVEPGRFTIAVGGKQPGLSGTADAATTAVVTGELELTGTVKALAP
jgi:hypothetical protein